MLNRPSFREWLFASVQLAADDPLTFEMLALRRHPDGAPDIQSRAQLRAWVHSHFREREAARLLGHVPEIWNRYRRFLQEGKTANAN